MSIKESILATNGRSFKGPSMGSVVVVICVPEIAVVWMAWIWKL
jgi:hypothetical protein